MTRRNAATGSRVPHYVLVSSAISCIRFGADASSAPLVGVGLLLMAALFFGGSVLLLSPAIAAIYLTRPPSPVATTVVIARRKTTRPGEVTSGVYRGYAGAREVEIDEAVELVGFPVEVRLAASVARAYGVAGLATVIPSLVLGGTMLANADDRMGGAYLLSLSSVALAVLVARARLFGLDERAEASARLVGALLFVYAMATFAWIFTSDLDVLLVTLVFLHATTALGVGFALLRAAPACHAFRAAATAAGPERLREPQAPS